MERKLSLTQLKDYLLLYSPLLIAFLVLLPRLLSAQFGMLDDGVILLVAKRAWENWLVAFSFSHELEQFFLENQGGRFLPVFWLYHTLVYGIIGPNPFLAFLVQSVVLASITGGLIWLVRFRGGSKIQAWAAGLCFVLSGAIIENFYTLGKTEPVQLLWLGLSFIIMTRYPRAQYAWQKTLLVLASATALLLALMTKETTLVLVPISLGWVWGGWSRLGGKPSPNLPARWAYLVASLIPIPIFFGLRAFFVPVSLVEGSNTSAYRLTWQTIIATASHEVGWLLRDFIYLAPLIVFIIVLAFLKKQKQSRLILDVIIWMLGWMSIYLPWHLWLEYYLFPFTVGASILGGIGFGQALVYLKSPQHGILRMLAGICLALALIPWPLMLTNNFTNARLQVAIDETNADFLDFTATLPPDSHIVMNLARINEYVIKTEPLLAITRNRPDISLDYFEFQVASPSQPELTYYIATPQMKNQPLPSVRIAVNEVGADLWNEALWSFLKPQQELVYQTEHEVKLFDIGLHRLSCPLFGLIGTDGLFCNINRPFVDSRTLLYGWKVYRVSSSIGDIALPAVFLPNGTWQLQKTNGVIEAVLFGQLGDMPVVGDWNGDRFTDIGVFRPENLTWYLDDNVDGQVDHEFQFTGMQANDIPLAGDWDGNGTTNPGYFRPEDSSWHFRNNNSSGGEELPVIQLGISMDVPIVGDWNGDGRDTIGIYRPNDGRIELWNDPSGPVIFSANPKSMPVVGDWAGRGFDSMAFVANGQWFRRFINCNCQPSNLSEPFKFGSPKGIPLAGKWQMSE